MMQAKVLFRLVRMEDWSKNLLVILPVFFAGGITHTREWPALVWTIASFCFLAGFVYIINDYLDIESDKHHPFKKNRPIPAGDITSLQAGMTAGLMLVCGQLSAWFAGPSVIMILETYLTINIAYSLIIKRIILLDALSIAAGYVLRIAAGGAAAGVPVSGWLYTVVILISLLITFGKRYSDLRLEATDDKKRNSRMFIPYPPGLLKFLAYCLAVAALAVYTAYTIDNEVVHRLETPWYCLTALPVALGFFRFTQQSVLRTNLTSPVRFLLSDGVMMTALTSWLALVVYFNYFGV